MEASAFRLDSLKETMITIRSLINSWWGGGTKEWNGRVEKRIKQGSNTLWRKGMENKSALALYKAKKAPAKESFYDNRLGSRLLFQCRAECSPLNKRTRHWGKEDKCRVCGNGELETLEHILLIHTWHENDTKSSFEKLKTINGVHMTRLSNEEVMRIILGFRYMQYKDNDTRFTISYARDIASSKNFFFRFFFLMLRFPDIYIYTISYSMKHFTFPPAVRSEKSFHTLCE